MFNVVFLTKNSFLDPAAVTEMWNIIQLQKQTEANRDGINKLMEITDGILNRLTPLNQYINDVNG